MINRRFQKSYLTQNFSKKIWWTQHLVPSYRISIPKSIRTSTTSQASSIRATTSAGPSVTSHMRSTRGIHLVKLFSQSDRCVFLIAKRSVYPNRVSTSVDPTPWNPKKNVTSNDNVVWHLGSRTSPCFGSFKPVFGVLGPPGKDFTVDVQNVRKCGKLSQCRSQSKPFTGFE